MEGRIWCLQAVQGLREGRAWSGPLVLPAVIVVGVWSPGTEGTDIGVRDTLGCGCASTQHHL